jgi:hypothetical protein
MSTAQEIFETLCNNNQFLTSIEVAIKNIIKNTQEDDIDITDIIFVITSSYNDFPSIKITDTDLPQLLEKLFIFVVQKYNLMSPNQLQFIETKLVSTIKLVMLQPNIHKYKEEIKEVKSLFYKLFLCCK